MVTTLARCTVDCVLRTVPDICHTMSTVVILSWIICLGVDTIIHILAEVCPSATCGNICVIIWKKKKKHMTVLFSIRNWPGCKKKTKCKNNVMSYDHSKHSPHWTLDRVGIAAKMQFHPSSCRSNGGSQGRNTVHSPVQHSLCRGRLKDKLFGFQLLWWTLWWTRL